MRRIALSLVALALVFAHAGCGRKSKPAGAGKSITIWWAKWDPAAGLQELGDEFEKETGIKVTVHQIDWSQYQTQVFLEFASKRTAFDIVVGDSQWIGKGATEGLYVDLTGWLPEAVDMGKIHPRAVKYLCEYPAGSGRYYAAPCEIDAVGFAYRTDWFGDPAEKKAFKEKYGRELGPPDTWDEFHDVAEFFTRPEKKRYGCALMTGRGYDALTMGYQQVMWAWGGSWGDPDTFKVEGHVNSPEAVEALTFFKGLLSFSPKGGGSFSYGPALEAFTNGSCATTMLYFAFFPGIVSQMGDKVGFFVMPKKGERRVVSLGGQGFSISKKVPASQQELAKKFIAWFLRTEIQKKWITKPAGFTANTEILRSDEFKEASPYNAAFADSLDYVRDFWNVPVYNELLAVAQASVGEALDGVKTPKEALDALAAEHEKIFKRVGLLKE